MVKLESGPVVSEDDVKMPSKIVYNTPIVDKVKQELDINEYCT